MIFQASPLGFLLVDIVAVIHTNELPLEDSFLGEDSFAFLLFRRAILNFKWLQNVGIS